MVTASDNFKMEISRTLEEVTGLDHTLMMDICIRCKGGLHYFSLESMVYNLIDNYADKMKSGSYNSVKNGVVVHIINGISFDYSIIENKKPWKMLLLLRRNNDIFLRIDENEYVLCMGDWIMPDSFKHLLDKCDAIEVCPVCGWHLTREGVCSKAICTYKKSRV